MRKELVAAAVLALASGAAAEDPAGAPKQDRSSRTTSDAFDQACIDLVRGKAPKGEQASDVLRDACAGLMKARADEKRQAEQQRQARRAQQQPSSVKPGESAAQPEVGQSALAAFVQASNELIGARPRVGIGMSRTGTPFHATVTTNTVGWFTGWGVNADYLRSFMPKFSWMGGAHYSQTASTDRSLYTLGFRGGVDWFIIGRNNEGLRIGPRLDYSFGHEAATGTSTRSRLGLTGEVGYNFVASNGLTAQAAFGVGGRVAGDKNEQLSSAVGGEIGPYFMLGLGFSW